MGRFTWTAAAALCLLTVRPASAGTPGEAETFIQTREEKRADYQHPDLKEAFPFGRSDLANDKKLAGTGAFDALTDYGGIDHKHFIAEGDRYAVEWLYHATWRKTKNKQEEASLCFARVKDQLLISWVEYFDDTVGELQDKHLLPLYGDPPALTPWPSPAATVRPYRP